MLPTQPHEPSRDDVHEAQPPAVLLDVEVLHVTYVHRPGVEDVRHSNLSVRRGGMLVPGQPNEVHEGLLPCLHAFFTFIANISEFYAPSVTLLLRSGTFLYGQHSPAGEAGGRSTTCTRRYGATRRTPIRSTRWPGRSTRASCPSSATCRGSWRISR